MAAITRTVTFVVVVVLLFIEIQLMNHYRPSHNHTDGEIQHFLGCGSEKAYCSRNDSDAAGLEGSTESQRLPTEGGTYPSVAKPNPLRSSSTAAAREDIETMVLLKPNASTSIKKGKPVLFWHVGPHKTSSTAVQTFLYKMENVLKQRDNIVMPLHLPGKCSKHKAPANIAYCLVDYEEWPNSWDECRACESPRSVVSNDCGQVLTAFHQFVESARVNSQNILLSSEGFSIWTTAQIQRLVSKYFADWDVRVIVYFRQWDEWLESVYFEWNRFKSLQIRHSLVDYFEAPGTLSCTAFQYSHAVRQRYQSVTNKTVTVVNFHAPTEKRSLIEQFVCDALQGMAPYTCRAAKKFAPTKINARYSFDAEFVLARALAMNLIPSMKRTEVDSIPNSEKEISVLLARINKKLQESENLPMRCLSDNTQGYIWNRTREWATFDRRPPSAPDQEEARPRMCSLDTSAIYQLDDWRELFQTTSSGEKG